MEEPVTDVSSKSADERADEIKSVKKSHYGMELVWGIVVIVSVVVGIFMFNKTEWFAVSSFIFFLSAFALQSYLSVRMESHVTDVPTERLTNMNLRESASIGLICWILAMFLYLMVPVLGEIFKRTPFDVKDLSWMICILVFAAILLGMLIITIARLVGRD